MGRLFKRPDKHCLPIYKAPDGIYRIQDSKVKGRIHREDGENDYEYSLVFRPYFRIEETYTHEEFEVFKKTHDLRCIDGEDRIHVYESNLSKLKEYYYDYTSCKLVIMATELYIAHGFNHYKDCLEFSEKYIKRKYSLKDKGDKNKETII